MASIFNDKFVSDYRNQETGLVFGGFQYAQFIVEETHKVGADCCRVYYIYI